VLKLLDAWDRATIHVVTDDGAVLQKVAQGEEDVLRQVGHRDDEQRARLIDHPRVVRLHVRHFGRHAEAAFPHFLEPAFNGFERGIEGK